jgi:ribosomal-protein-alanine N-acetyltransferase
MNALLAPEPALRPMGTRDLDAVLAIEASAYGFPWSRGNFIDSLAAGYAAQVLIDAAAGIVGYFVAMAGVDEMHLLNITVAPAWQGRGLARLMLDALEADCRAQRRAMLWLEVRAGNERARALYVRRGFVEVGVRRGYYPAASSKREDAVVMSLRLRAEDSDALD